MLVNPIGLEAWKRKVSYQTIDEWYQQELEKTPSGVKQYMQESYFDGRGPTIPSSKSRLDGFAVRTTRRLLACPPGPAT